MNEALLWYYLFTACGVSPVESQPCSAMASELAATQKFVRGTQYDIRNYGAVDDGVTDATDAIQLTIASAARGSRVLVPASGQGFIVSRPLLIDKPLNLECIGSLNVSASFPSNADVIHVRGPADTGSIKGCVIKPVSVTLARHGVHLDATGTYNGQHYLARWTIEGNSIGPFGGAAVRMSFPAGTDGVFNSKIINNPWLWNGIECDRCGDTVEIAGNTIAGKGPGISVGQVYGASQLQIVGNSIVGCPPAVRVIRGSGVRIARNNIEPNIAADPSCALADGAIEILGSAESWDGRDGAAVGNTITDNSIVNIPQTVKYGLVIGANTRSTVATGNRFGLAGYWDAANTQPQRGILVSAGARDTFLGYNSCDYVSASACSELLVTNYSIPGNTIVVQPREGVLAIDGAVSFLPNGYEAWVFRSNYLYNKGSSGLPASALPAACASGDPLIVFCPDCKVSSGCDAGGSGSWAFGNGSTCTCH